MVFNRNSDPLEKNNLLAKKQNLYSKVSGKAINRIFLNQWILDNNRLWPLAEQ